MIRASSGKTRTGRLLLGAGVLVAAMPVVAGCEAGADAPTQQYHSASSGAQAVFDGIRITNAFVLGAPTGSTLPSGSSASLFVSIYNSNTGSDTLESATAPGTAGSISLAGGAVALPANSAPVNLTGPQPEVVLQDLTLPLRGGTSIPVTFTFQHAGTVKLQLPVEAQSFQWATFSPPASATPTAGSTGTATPTATPNATGTATATATATP